jgi:hypothetical protein
VAVEARGVEGEVRVDAEKLKPGKEIGDWEIRDWGFQFIRFQMRWVHSFDEAPEIDNSLILNS